MKINFPKEETNLSSTDAFTAYSHLADYHLHFLKQQSRCESLYWKGAGIFFLLTIAFFILKEYGFTLSPFIGILITGIGTLLMLAQNIRIDFEYALQAAACVKKGLSIEREYNYPGKIFRIYEDNKLLSYRGYLLSRLMPLEFIALSTSIAGVALALKVDTWLATVVALFSLTVLFSGTRFFIRMSRKTLLESLDLEPTCE